MAQKWAKSRQTLASTPCKRNAHEDGKLLIKNLLLLCHRVWWCRGEPGTAAARGAVSDAGVRSREQSRVQHPPPAVSDPIRIHTKDLVVDLKNKMLI